MTLPERILTSLSEIDQDRARAIVKAVEAVTHSRKNVEMVEVAKGVGIILVGPSRALKSIPWLQLTEVAPTRFLLSIPSGTSVDSLELAISDVLAGLPAREEAERETLRELQTIMKSLRLTKAIWKGEILFIDTLKNSLLKSTFVVPWAVATLF